MSLIEQFKHISNAAERGVTASLQISVDGTEYTRNFRPKERLILLGGGNIAQPLCTYGADLGFEVIVADDRPAFANRPRFPEAKEVHCDFFPEAIHKIGIREGDYVAVITRGHRYDADCLREILPGTMPKYLGMIGSRRRTIGLLQMLEEEGITRERLDQVHTPIGVNIGALTVKEIAISIVAELIQVRRSDTKRHSHSTLLTAEDIDLPLLRHVSNEKNDKVLLLVLETSGSTPVKSGAYMVVDSYMQTRGTIGGGCSENALLRQACYFVGTGRQEVETVDLSNEVAAQEGMACGGQMKVLIADLSKTKGEHA